MYRQIRRETCVLPVPGSPTIMMTSLSDAVAPTTSSGVAFSPSGMTCGLGLSITFILFSGCVYLCLGMDFGRL